MQDLRVLKVWEQGLQFTLALYKQPARFPK
jgi:hypothetical protein